MFILRFLAGNLIFSCGVCLLCCARKMLGKRIPAGYQYAAWLVILFSLVLPFIPATIVHAASTTVKTLHAPAVGQEAVTTLQETSIREEGWIADIACSVSTQRNVIQSKAISVVWAAGIVVVLISYVQGALRLRRVIRTAYHPDDAISAIFETSRHKAKSNLRVTLMMTNTAKGPFSLGIINRYIILPEGICMTLNKEELENILLHELSHLRHRDILINYLFCLVQALCWFNPVVWLAFPQMRLDQEAWCDWTVLNTLRSEDERLSYGDTLLQFVRASKHHISPMVNGLYSGKTQLRYRIEKIVQFQSESRKAIAAGLAFVITMGVFVSVPFSVLAFSEEPDDIYYTAGDIQLVDGDFGGCFGIHSGCAVIYDSAKEEYIVWNRSEITKRTAPCSTIKIYSAINALEQGHISPADSMIAWNGTLWPYDAWNVDQDLTSALRNSVNWYFQGLDISAGTEELQRFYNRIGYGNCNIGEDPAWYWNGSSLKISAIEQVKVLKRVMENDYGFQPANVSAIKDAMLVSSGNSARLYGKTGSGYANGEYVIGWFIGLVETLDNEYYFAVRLSGNDHADGDTAAEIACSVFEAIGITIR